MGSSHFVSDAMMARKESLLRDALGGKDEHLHPLFLCVPLDTCLLGVPHSPDGVSQRTSALLAPRCLCVSGPLERSCLHGAAPRTTSPPSTNTRIPKEAYRGSSLPNQGRAARVVFPLST